MNKLLKTVCVTSLALLPLLASADVASSTIPVPVHVSPVDNVALTTSLFTNIDWTDTSIGSTSLLYYYELSRATSTGIEGNFTLPVATSSLLASSTITTVGTSEGVYYWHVRSSDAFGVKSFWSTPWKIIIDNTAPSSPTALVLVASSAPVVVGTSTLTQGSQTWSFSPSLDTSSGVTKYQYAVSGTSTWNENGLATSFMTSLGIGSHTVSVRAFDRAGNISTSTSVLLFITSSSTSATTTPPQVIPGLKSQCKKNGWKTFTNPTFKNQGKCISYVEKMLHDKKKELQHIKTEHKNKQEQVVSILEKQEDERKKAVASTLTKAHKEREEKNSSSLQGEREGENHGKENKGNKKGE